MHSYILWAVLFADVGCLLDGPDQVLPTPTKCEPGALSLLLNRRRRLGLHRSSPASARRRPSTQRHLHQPPTTPRRFLRPPSSPGGCLLRAPELPLRAATAPPTPRPPLCMKTLVRLAGGAASLSRSGRAAAPCGPVFFARRWRAFQGARMENGGGKSGRGALVVLEGLDRSGKSSQCARLLSFLEGSGCRAEGWRFPDRGTSVGQMISAYLANESRLDDRTIHLLFSANRWEKRGLMESKLLSGTTLIVDRYSYSGVAFSAAKGLDIGWCKAPEVGLLAPDLVIYLDVQPEKAAERGGYGGERYERIEFQKKVAEHYQSLRDSTWKVVDGSLPMETVEEQLRELATNCIRECQGKPLTNLAW